MFIFYSFFNIYRVYGVGLLLFFTFIFCVTFVKNMLSKLVKDCWVFYWVGIPFHYEHHWYIIIINNKRKCVSASKFETFKSNERKWHGRSASLLQINNLRWVKYFIILMSCLTNLYYKLRLTFLISNIHWKAIFCYVTVYSDLDVNCRY